VKKEFVEEMAGLIHRHIEKYGKNILLIQRGERGTGFETGNPVKQTEKTIACIIKKLSSGKTDLDNNKRVRITGMARQAVDFGISVVNRYLDETGNKRETGRRGRSRDWIFGTVKMGINKGYTRVGELARKS
jgi:hypothetical protein